MTPAVLFAHLSVHLYRHGRTIRYATVPVVLLAALTLPWLATSAVCICAAALNLVMAKYCCYHESSTVRKFSERECHGGRLYYHPGTNVPILELSAIDARACGFAHGYLLAEAVRRIAADVRLLLALQRVAAFFADVAYVCRHRAAPPARVPRREILIDLARQLDAHVLAEMEEVVRGCNVYWREVAAGGHNRVAPVITVDDLLAMHLLPDSKYFSAACTSVLARDDLGGDAVDDAARSDVKSGASSATAAAVYPKVGSDAAEEGKRGGGVGGTILGRNMDWALGRGGALTVCIVWRTRGIAAISFPGCCGVVSGWNRDRLVLLMHICPPPPHFASPAILTERETVARDGKKIVQRRLPALFYNRRMLEQARSVDAVLARVQDVDAEAVPLGPYHMVVADAAVASRAAIVSLHQDATAPAGHRVKRHDRPYESVLNFSMPSATHGSFNSHERRAILEPLFAEWTRDVASAPAPATTTAAAAAATPSSGVGSTSAADAIGSGNATAKQADGLPQRPTAAATTTTATVTNLERVRAALALRPLIDSPITLQHMVFQPSRALIELAWDNGFAASQPRYTLPMDAVFSARADAVATVAAK